MNVKIVDNIDKTQDKAVESLKMRINPILEAISVDLSDIIRGNLSSLDSSWYSHVCLAKNEIMLAKKELER